MSTVTFNVKNLDGEHLCNFCSKCNAEEYCWKHSPFDLEINGQTTMCFDKGGYKKKSVTVEDTPHTEDVELEECGRYTWRETI